MVKFADTLGSGAGLYVAGAIASAGKAARPTNPRQQLRTPALALLPHPPFLAMNSEMSCFSVLRGKSPAAAGRELWPTSKPPTLAPTAQRTLFSAAKLG